MHVYVRKEATRNDTSCDFKSTFVDEAFELKYILFCRFFLRKSNSLGECKQSTDWKSADDTREYPPHASPMPFLNHLASPEFKSAWEEKQISARTKGSRKVVFQSFWSFFWGPRVEKFCLHVPIWWGQKKAHLFLWLMFGSERRGWKEGDYWQSWGMLILKL